MDEAISRLTDISSLLANAVTSSLKTFGDQLQEHIRSTRADHDAIVKLTTVSDLTLNEIRSARNDSVKQYERLSVKVETLEGACSTVTNDVRHVSVALAAIKADVERIDAEAARKVEIDGIKNEVRDLDRARWKLIGAIGGSSFVLAFLGTALSKLVFR